MKLHNFIKLAIIIAAITCSLAPTRAPAQNCQNTYKKCEKPAKGYRQTSGTRGISIRPGESKKLAVTFFKGRDYKIAICSKNDLPNLQLRIMASDSSSQVLYDNSIYEFAHTFDFRATDTRPYIIEIGIPQNAIPSATQAKECVGILVSSKFAPGARTKYQTVIK